jgi:prepilin-type N-terminal cleavage/methylation domain-containing protein
LLTDYHQKHAFGSPSRRFQAENGFTFIEVIISVILLGIVGAVGVAKLSQFFRRQALVGEGKALVEYLREARAYGAKKGMQVGIAFNADSGSYTLFEDRNGNSAIDAGESVRAHKLAKNIAFGSAVNGPGLGPDGNAVPANGLRGCWASALIYPKDLTAGPDSGVAYLRQVDLKTVTFAIQVIPGDAKFGFSLWEGSAWRRL